MFCLLDPTHLLRTDEYLKEMKFVARIIHTTNLTRTFEMWLLFVCIIVRAIVVLPVSFVTLSAARRASSAAA